MTTKEDNKLIDGLKEELTVEPKLERLTMRTLSGQDLFPVITMISKVGVKDMVKNYFKGQAETIKKAKAGETGDDAFEMAGMNFMAEIIETVMMNIERVRPDINRILASLCEVNVAKIESLDMDDYMALFIDFFTKPELERFLKSIGSLMSK